ncbi:hypothetical protein ABPG74_004571 [Tetrahymena malaccensis]
MNNMNNSILQNLNQINNDQCHTDNEYSSSRISFQDQKKIFEFYDNKFGKEGLVGDHDDEIQEKQVCQDEVKIHENEAHQIQNQLSIIQKENQEQNKESFKNISKPFMKNFSYQNTNEQNKLYLNYKLTFFKKPSINSINSKSLRSSDNKNRYDLSDSQRLINLNQNKRSDQIIEEEYNQKIEISSNLVKENFKKKVISQSLVSYGMVQQQLKLVYNLVLIVGYGDITPSNAAESLFVTVIMIFMSCVFAYSINNIGLILQEIEKDSKELNDKLSIIHKFMQMKGVNLELQRRISKKLKQQAVYLGSKIFKMFEKNSIESENDEEGDQITTKKKNLDDLSSDSSQSSNNSIESQSQTSINNIKVTSKKQKQVKTKSKSISDNKISIENQNSKLIDHDQIKAATSDQSQKSSVNLNEIQIEKQISYNQNNEKYNQRQSQQLSQENKSQDKFQSNILNQSSELVINHREGISERKISQQASIQQSSMQLNQLCSSLINIVKQQEIQIQTLNQQRENQKHSLNNSKSQDDFCDPNKQTQIVVQDDILNEFDKSKNFLHFFPHNNLRTVLKQIKIQQQKKNNINIKNKIAQQPRRRQNVNFTQSIFEKKSKMVIENQDLIEYLNKSKPTFCSYGFYIKNCSLYPLRASQ